MLRWLHIAQASNTDEVANREMSMNPPINWYWISCKFDKKGTHIADRDVMLSSKPRYTKPPTSTVWLTPFDISPVPMDSHATMLLLGNLKAGFAS